MNQTNTPTERRAPQSFSYGRLIVETRLTGLPAMIACFCEPVYYSADVGFLRLEMPEALDSMKETPAMEQFKVALKEFFGEALEIEIVPGPALKSPASQSTGRKLESVAKAHELVMTDDFVQKMIKDFGAKVLIETIAPAAPAQIKKPG